MNTKQDEALSMERALKMAQDWYDSGHEDPDEFTEMIKQVIALALVNKVDQEQPAPVAEPHKQQEPVAWGVDWGKAGDQSCVSIIKRLPDGGIEVLATEYGPPASKPWVGLTDEQIMEMYNEPRSDAEMIEFARAIEAAHGIKEQT